MADMNFTNEDLASLLNFLENPDKNPEQVAPQYMQQVPAALTEPFGNASVSQLPPPGQRLPQFEQAFQKGNDMNQAVQPRAWQENEAPRTMVWSENPEVVQAVKVINRIFELQKQQKEKVEKIRHVQKDVMQNPAKNTFDLLMEQHQRMKEQMDEEVTTLLHLRASVILPPNEIHRLELLLQDLRIQATQTELFYRELQTLLHSHANRCVAALVVVDQPFPMVVTKSKQLDDDPLMVHLLTGANVQIQSFSKMKAVMISDSQPSKQINSNKVLEQDTQSLDTYRRCAKWNLKFVQGTRKNPATLRFGMQIQVAHGDTSVQMMVESRNTNPFIVITNECQWEESEGVLLRKDVFGEEAVEAPWPALANHLQKYFLRGTRQDPNTPARALSPRDFEHIHRRYFGGQMMVSQPKFVEFWNWFGKTMQKLRYQRHILPLYSTGMIHVFLSRELVEEILSGQDVGSFVIRFSERHAGSFAIGYVVHENGRLNVRHYLMKPDDTAGAKKTLPDFLAEQPAFQYIMQYCNEEMDHRPVFRRYPKDHAMETYYSKRATVPAASGYDDNVQNKAEMGYDDDMMGLEIMNAE